MYSVGVPIPITTFFVVTCVFYDKFYFIVKRYMLLDIICAFLQVVSAGIFFVLLCTFTFGAWTRGARAFKDPIEILSLCFFGLICILTSDSVSLGILRMLFFPFFLFGGW